ncbi:hypothetical protein QFZ77_007499 [Paenibacillus sp. V4I3]|nr:hypothetical protein [Paenibacillus sp. V4I3]
MLIVLKFPLAIHAPIGAPRNNENFFSRFYNYSTAGEEGR